MNMSSRIFLLLLWFEYGFWYVVEIGANGCFPTVKIVKRKVENQN